MSEPSRSDSANAGDPREGRARLARFLAGGTGSRLFRWPTGNPARQTGFCFCEHSVWGMIAVCVRAAILELLLKLPFNGLKAGFLRHLGARIDRHAYISAGAWIDPTFTQLLHIEEDVFIGAGARITLHEFRRNEFRAGRVILRRGAFIGGYAMIGCGVEIGEGATVAAGAVVGRDVPAGFTAIGNPARIVGPAVDPPGKETLDDA
jgi:acetyltransferase-like isoleucine patch superfamily enzyme